MAEDDYCDQCGSTDFAVEDDGRTYCANGHEQNRGVVTAEDDQDYARQGKVVRKKEKKVKQKLSKILRGAKAYQLYLQAWQYILWKQSYTLVHQLGLPADLWTVVRDLWSLWLTKLEPRLLNDPATPGRGVSDSEGELQDRKSGDKETDTDAEITDRECGLRDGDRMHNHAVRKGPGLIDTVVLNYLALVLLRCPVELASMLSWIHTETIPFVRAIRFIPQDMKDRLPSEYHAALDTPTRLPEPDDLQLAVYWRSQMFDSFFGMITPPLNHLPFFVSYMRSLALPIEVYSLALRLNRITKYDFAYLEQIPAAGGAKIPSLRRNDRRHATSYPEAQIISLIVVATKLLYPFDSATVSRHPKSPNDLATLRMDWAAWLAAKKEMENSLSTSQSDATTSAADSLKPGTEMSITDADALSMTDAQLDQYLDWYQRTWLNPGPGEQQSQIHSQSQPQSQEPNAVDQTILNLFPLRSLPSVEKTRLQHADAAQQRETLLARRIDRVQRSLSPVRAISPAEEVRQHSAVLRPGSRYPRYRRVEDLDGGGGVVGAFHAEAAQAACLSVSALLKAVARTEDLIEVWRRERRREEYFAADEDGDEEKNEEEGGGDGDENEHEHEGKGKGKAETSGRRPRGVGRDGLPHPSSSAALVRGLGDLDIGDLEAPVAAEAGYGDGHGGEGVGDSGDEVMDVESSGDGAGEEDDEQGRSEVDVDMEMAMEYLPQL